MTIPGLPLLYHTIMIVANIILTSEMLPSGTRLTNSFGIFFRTSSKVSLKCFSKSAGVRVGTSLEHLYDDKSYVIGQVSVKCQLILIMPYVYTSILSLQCMMQPCLCVYMHASVLVHCDLPETNIIGTNKDGHQFPVILHVNIRML